MLKNGSQQSTKHPTMIPIVLAALVSILNFLTLKIRFGSTGLGLESNWMKDSDWIIKTHSCSYLWLDVPFGEGGLALLEAVCVSDKARAQRVVGLTAILPRGHRQGAPRQRQPQARPGLQLQTRRVEIHQTPLWFGSASKGRMHKIFGS